MDNKLVRIGIAIVVSWLTITVVVNILQFAGG